MAIKNNDDVAHLIQATGASGSPYREFESASDHMSAPLIDAVFSKDRPEAGPDSAPGIDAAREGNLLAEIFDRPRGGNSLPAASPAWRGEASPSGVRQSVSAPATFKRSLDDIRRVITRPTEETAKASPTEGLNGVFDRLAG